MTWWGWGSGMDVYIVLGLNTAVSPKSQRGWRLEMLSWPKSHMCKGELREHRTHTGGQSTESGVGVGTDKDKGIDRVRS